MKFFVAIVLMAFVAIAIAEEPTAARKLEPVKEVEPSAEAEGQASSRGKRGFVLGAAAYTAPLAPAVEVAAPLTAAYSAAPVAYTYSAGVPYAYSAYSAYSPYYSYPAVYV